MNEETEVAYYCPYCESETSIIVSIKSPTNYHVADECCPNCDAQIEGGTIDDMVAEAVRDHFAAQGELVCDESTDGDFGDF